MRKYIPGERQERLELGMSAPQGVGRGNWRVLDLPLFSAVVSAGFLAVAPNGGDMNMHCTRLRASGALLSV